MAKEMKKLFGPDRVIKQAKKAKPLNLKRSARKLFSQFQNAKTAPGRTPRSL